MTHRSSNENETSTEKERYVVSDVESVPDGTQHEHRVRAVAAFVDYVPQPFCRHLVPVIKQNFET